ncbi:bifunctional uroporphyrinogen-III C-methyltransferase/uroporphyrinogen-III synthase [Mangrovactinospora gilvigrisea]|uniref:uroporphyrinogen-III C-methyltransferase n=1 Tax=Mangrovactinospora gilvigrisea TaxID=1428644 RepID=A0A1J7C4B0_9ACTN|nr:bifunctional uroporphyrinogen-III C-methyltransferase/uroporphyrinogen-III synthase [Mangrovactinospora gilvigrisea]OIV36384.1 bifunctional uroporphyrinogen-III C-methyltransferase/uroporphyrinogen-III synthase [Mangrovactinospora gilvigrisea]
MATATDPIAHSEEDAAHCAPGSRSEGRVTFLGAGPGDPGLLTLRGASALAAADVVIADPGTLTVADEHCPRHTERTELPLAESSGDGLKLAMEAARAGRRVVRCVAGDPGLDGAIAAEMLDCARAGVPFEVVPGIARAAAVPSYAGMPLRGSGAGAGVRFADAAQLGDEDWAELAASAATLVIAAPLAEMPRVAADLVVGGRAPDTPVAVTIHGTTTRQRTWQVTLGTVQPELKAAKMLPTAAQAADHVSPQAIAVVGDAVRQRDDLSWFETKPLFGWNVLVPRTKEQAPFLSDQLRSYGAVPAEVPTIAVEPPRTPQQMERAIKGLVTGRYEWVAFTSQNAVKAVREKFEDYGLDARAFAGIKVAAVGESTARALVEFGVKPDLVPSGEQSAAGLLEEWPPYDPVFDPIDRVFLPRADIATETLVAGLVDLGWEVDDVTAYRTVRASPPPAETREAIKGGGFDAVLFTSSSTVRNLVGIAGKPHSVTVIACIGPATAKTAEEHGLRVDVLSPEPTVAALAEALAEYGAARRDAALEAGERVLRPSEKRAGRRRKSVL